MTAVVFMIMIVIMQMHGACAESESRDEISSYNISNCFLWTVVLTSGQVPRLAHTRVYLQADLQAKYCKTLSV